MIDRAAGLDAQVVASSDDLSCMDQNRADRDTAFGQTFLGFFDRRRYLRKATGFNILYE